MAGLAPWDRQYDTQKATQGPGGSAAQLPPWAQDYALDPAARPKQPAESQRMRMMAQGASLGWSDEAEAAFRSIFPGTKYDDVVKEIRQEINAYKTEQPGVALMQEVAGGMMTGAGLLRTLAGKSPTLLRLFATAVPVGAIEGGTMAAGLKDGTPLERLTAVPSGALIGATAGPAGVLIGKGAESTLNALTNFARRRLGGRGASIVEKELQRVMRDSELSVDEIIKKIEAGEILAENATIRDTVRAYTRGGGPAGATLREALTRRPGELREDAMQTLNKYLAPSMDGNVRKIVTATDDELAKLENAMYESAYGQGAVITEPLLNAMSAAFKRTRGKAADDLEEAYTAQTGNTPFFTINKKGEVLFDRAPTLRDAEVIRQSLSDMAFAKRGSGAGRGYQSAQEVLREEINVASPALNAARADAAVRRNAKDMFNDGKDVFSQNADQVDIDFSKLMQSNDMNAVRYYRMGAMDSIRGRMAGGNRTTMLRKLADPETKEGQILRHIFPGDELDRVLGDLGRATQSAQAAGQVLGGSGTAPTQMAAQRIGQSISLEEGANALAGNVFAGLNVARKLVGRLAPANLSPQQRDRIAQIMVSENPDVVRKAFVDESGLAKLQASFQRITGLLPGAGLGMGATLSGVSGANMSQGQ